MSTASLATPPASEGFAAVPAASHADAPLRVARLSVDQYHMMIDAGVFAEDERVELLDGVLVKKMAINPRHSVVTETVHEIIRERLPRSVSVRQEQPITLALSEPEPDLAVVRGKRSDYIERHPTAEDCVLLVEVADSSISRDEYKGRLYAEAGVPEYWIVDLDSRRIVVHGGPSPEGYRQIAAKETACIQIDETTVEVSFEDLPG